MGTSGMKFKIGQRVRDARGEECVVADVQVSDGARLYLLRRAWGALMPNWYAENQLSAVPVQALVFGVKQRPASKRRKNLPR